jgi:hypothetical protein
MTTLDEWRASLKKEPKIKISLEMSPGSLVNLCEGLLTDASNSDASLINIAEFVRQVADQLPNAEDARRLKQCSADLSNIDHKRYRSSQVCLAVMEN